MDNSEEIDKLLKRITKVTQKETENLNGPVYLFYKAAIAKYHRLGDLSNRNLFSHSLGN